MYEYGNVYSISLCVFCDGVHVHPQTHINIPDTAERACNMYVFGVLARDSSGDSVMRTFPKDRSCRRCMETSSSVKFAEILSLIFIDFFRLHDGSSDLNINWKSRREQPTVTLGFISVTFSCFSYFRFDACFRFYSNCNFYFH